ncbi:N-acetyltransferase 9-like protein [Mytilus trossulus]|uniref:N-acetyltransferase 9-like protein n=1 Tax=Mytilus trossulus TaxID=6551 RepID=UPI003006EF17
MRKNQNVKIKGEKVTLIPYEALHVPKYHSWMQSEELQELTASEPLSLEEEYDMQRSWREDEKKCTFIVLQTVGVDEEQDEIGQMIGDVNIFFNEEEDLHCGEIEIMIAEPKARGKGCGKEALFSMMRYGIEELNMKRFTAKIGMDNKPSLAMFKSIGFSEISRSEVFSEITLELNIDDDFKKTLYDKTNMFQILNYR